MKKFLSTTVICISLLFNLLGVSAANTSKSKDSATQIKKLRIAYSGTCYGKATLYPPDINGISTVTTRDNKELEYKVGTKVKIVSNNKVRCAIHYHILSGESERNVVMDSDQTVYFSFRNELIPTPTRTIYFRLKGDLNCDGRVTPTDFAIMRTEILGILPTRFSLNVIDMNDDGELTVMDYALLRKLLLASGKT